MKRIIPLLFAAAPFAAAAQTKEIDVLDPGTISLEISDAEKNTITDLTVRGALDGTDILYLIEMAGTTVYHDSEKTPGQLKRLDLSGASIVSGGAKYSQWPNYSTENDVVGGNMWKHTILEYIALPAQTKAIGDNAFMECSALKDIVIPATVQSIGSYAFNECHALTSIALPEGITALKDATFMNCRNLTSVAIPSTVTTIGGNVFNGCPITSISLPASVKSIGYDAFCSALTELHVAAREVPAAGFRAFNSINKNTCTLYVPEGTADAYRVAAEWSTFTNIVEEAASEPVVTDLAVELSEAGTLADRLTAEQQATLTTLKISGPINALDLRLIREMAGSDEHYDVTTGMLTSLDLSEADIVADPDLYYAINPYSTPENPIYMTIWSTTMDATGMLPPLAFQGCHIEHIDLPKSLVTIASSFCGCPLKGELVIPEGVTHIRDYAFEGCTQLESIVLPSTLRKVGNADPYYPDAIGVYAFSGCSALTSINLPEGVTTLREGTFMGTGFETFVVPATVQTICDHALADMKQLKEVRAESAVPAKAQYGAFDGVDFETVNLVVPDGAETAYRGAEEWCRFYGLDFPETVGVNAVGASSASSASYNLQGRRVASKSQQNGRGPQGGALPIICNGRKVMQ